MLRSTPRSTRSAVREELSRMLRGWLHELDLSQDDVARHVGADQQKVSEWVNPTRPLVPGISDLRLMPRDLAVRALRWAADGHQLAVIDVVIDGSNVREHLDHLARILKESGDVTSEYARAVADGVVSPDERRKLLKEARELVAALMALIHKLEGDEIAERALTAPGGRA